MAISPEAKRYAALFLTASFASLASFAQGAKGIPEPAGVPELMETFGGEKVDSVAKWEKVRRPEILKCFEEQCFGVRPEAVRDGKRISYKIRETNDVLGGKAVREVVDATYSGPCGDYVFTFVSMHMPRVQMKL